VSTEDPKDPPAVGRLKRHWLNISERFTLRQRLLFLLLLASVPGMLAAVLLAVNALSDQTDYIETSAKRLAAIQAAQHSNTIDNARIMLDTLVETLTLRNVDQAECQPFLENWVERYLSFTTLTLLDTNGNIVCSNIVNGVPHFTADEDFFVRALTEGDFVVGDYSVSRTGKPLIVAARPIFDERQQITGVVAVGIDLRWMEFLARRMDLPAGSTVTALNSNGDILSHTLAEVDQGESSGTQAQTAPEEELRRAAATFGSGVQRGRTEGGNHRVYGFEGTESGRLVIVVGMPEFMEFERYGAALRDTLTAPIAIIILALIAAAYASESLVTRWVRMLTGAAERMADGDLSVRSNVPHTRYEIGRLAAAFDGMATTIQREQQSLRRMIDQRHALLRELNHRVKNNLQMIVSLLSIQSRSLSDASAKSILSDLISRVRALSEIHDLLHGGRADGPVPAHFTVSLAKFLSEFYGSDICRLEMAVEPVQLSPDQAVTLGLIMNELISNACKHAFPDEVGVVRVGLQTSANQVNLSVADNGTALAGDLESHLRSGSIGLKMVQSMARQINGNFDLQSDGKWKIFRLQFPVTSRDSNQRPAS
jgi:two-component sensor histidine kinase